MCRTWCPRDDLVQAHTLPTPQSDAEALDSARSPAEYEQVRADRRKAYEDLPTGREVSPRFAPPADREGS